MVVVVVVVIVVVVVVVFVVVVVMARLVYHPTHSNLCVCDESTEETCQSDLKCPSTSCGTPQRTCSSLFISHTHVSIWDLIV